MRTFLLLALAALVALPAGCQRPRSVLAGGKPVRHWVEALRSGEARTRRQAALKLGNVGAGEPAVLPALLGALNDPDAGVRRAAILALLKCGPAARHGEPALAELGRRDPDPGVRACAEQALEKLRGG